MKQIIQNTIFIFLLCCMSALKAQTQDPQLTDNAYTPSPVYYPGEVTIELRVMNINTGGGETNCVDITPTPSPANTSLAINLNFGLELKDEDVANITGIGSDVFSWTYNPVSRQIYGELVGTLEAGILNLKQILIECTVIGAGTNQGGINAHLTVGAVPGVNNASTGNDNRAFNFDIIDNSSTPTPSTVCHPEGVVGTGEASKVGITTLNRSLDNDNWLNNVENGQLVLESDFKGFVITSMDAESIPAADLVAGMLVHDNVGDNCLKLYTGDNWTCVEQTCIGGFTPPASTVTAKTFSTGLFHSLVIGADGNVYGTGTNAVGELGDGNTGIEQKTPIAASLPTDAGTPVKVSAGRHFSMVLTDANKIYAYGYNNKGQFGNNTTTDSATPVLAMQNLPAGVIPADIEVGGFTAYIIDQNGNVYGSGYNESGQLALDRTITEYNTPQLISLPSGLPAVQISTANRYQSDITYILDSNGDVYALGYFQDTSMGNASYHTNPTLMQLPSGVKAVQVSADAHMILGDDGNVYNCLAYDSSQITMPGNVQIKQISGTYTNSIFLDVDGNVYGMGYNDYAELSQGYADSVTYTSPIQFNLPTGITAQAISVGGPGEGDGNENWYPYILILGSDGNVYGIGAMGYGQLGIGNVTPDGNAFGLSSSVEDDYIVDLTQVILPTTVNP